jgi:hypothetical protein
MARKLNSKGFAERKTAYAATRSGSHATKMVVQAKRKLSASDSVYASDELIAERRAEAVKEDEETLRWLSEGEKNRG